MQQWRKVTGMGWMLEATPTLDGQNTEITKTIDIDYHMLTIVTF